MKLSLLTMKLSLLAAVAHAVAAYSAESGPAAITAQQTNVTSSTRGRELQTTIYTCHDPNGHDIGISSTCCEEISQQGLDRVSPCNQTDFPCTATFNKETGKMECLYDIPKGNPKCAELTRSTCLAKGGRATENNVTLTCENITIYVQNQIDCMGSACGEHDIKEYILAMADLAKSHSTSTCQFTEINGESIAQIRYDDFISSLVAGVMVAALAGLYFYVRCWRRVAIKRRQPQNPTFRPVASAVELS